MGLLHTILMRLWEAIRDPQRWRSALTRNIALKLLSLSLAFGLWSFVNFGERDTEETLKVPIELRNLPPQFMITSPRVDFVDVRVVGPRTLLGRVDKNRLSLPLDLSGVKPGPSVFRFGTESLILPRGVSAVRVNPAQVSIELKVLSHKTVPVRLRLVGKPPEDLVVADMKVSPELVEVSGPATDIEDVDAAFTQPIDVSRVEPGTLERELPLEPSGDYLSFSASRVAAQLRVEEVATTREFKRVPVRVRDTALDATISPSVLRVAVRGPKGSVSGLVLEEKGAWVSMAGKAPGEFQMKPLVELPEGCEVVLSEPASVRVTLSARRLRRIR